VGEEKIIHAAGAKAGSLMTRTRLSEMITQAGYIPVERDSLYHSVDNFQNQKHL
jgi:aminodeoxyfutalosine synthase